MFYVNERWLGGMLTNFKTIQSRIARLKEIETMAADGTFEVLPKKEVIALKKEWEKLEKNLGGIKEMKKIPDAIFIVDPKKERICVQEAHTLGITLIGIADTNCDPEELLQAVMSNPKFLYSAFYSFTSQDMMHLLEEAGVPLKTERGNRVFPVSDHSSDIIHGLERLNEKISCTDSASL
mgnify:CR=1 FL=1